MEMYILTTTSNPAADTTDQDNLIDNLTFGYLTLIITVIINPIINLIAFLGAIVNVLTFSKMELNKGVNQNLLVLSVSDLVIASIGLAGNTCYALLWIGVRNGQVQTVLTIMMWVVAYPINSSTVVTTTIAVVRCLSVVMPLTFRTVVTARRQLVAIALGCCVSWSVGLYTNVRVLAVNTWAIVSTSEFNRLMAVFDYFRNTFLFTCLSIMILSGAFLAKSLRNSSKFQTQHSSTSDSKPTSSSRREAQVVQTILLLLVIFVACNIPLLVLSLMRMTVSGFSSTGKYRRHKLLAEYLSGSGVYLNVALNILVYLKYNSQFRSRLVKILTSLRFNSK